MSERPEPKFGRKPEPVKPFLDLERIEKLKVRRRWWMRPVCWIKREHLHKGQPLTLAYMAEIPVTLTKTAPMAVMEQACARCGKTKFNVGVDLA